MEEVKNPLVSFIMPVYNSEDTIHRAVHGIQRQSYANLEIILVDDGSTDGTLALLRQMEAEDSRVHVIAKENGGPASARNAGLAVAKGKWIHFHDSDDWMAPNTVERMVEATTWGPCDMVVTNFKRVHNGKARAKGRGRDGNYDALTYLRGMSLTPSDFFYACSWNKFLKREILEEYGLRQNEDVRYGEDHLLLLEYQSHLNRVAVVHDPLYYYLNRPGSLLHQGLTPSGFIKNRLTLFPTYRSLLKKQGVSRGLVGKLKIAFFLFAPGTDALLSPWDKQLRPEEVPE